MIDVVDISVYNPPELLFEHHVVTKRKGMLILEDSPFHLSVAMSTEVETVPQRSIKLHSKSEMEREVLKEMFFQMEESRLDCGVRFWNEDYESFYKMFIERVNNDKPKTFSI